MMGQVIRAGTGLCDIYLDEEKMIKELSNIKYTKDDFLKVDDKNIDHLLKEDSEEEEEY